MNSKKDFMSEHLTNLNEKIKKCNIQAKNLEHLHTEAEKPQPLNLDEVSAAFISSVRVNDWEILGEMFGGYKIGRIYSYILNALNERIEDSTAATIRVDVPLYEQCPTVLLKNERTENKQEDKNEEKICAYCKETDGTINHDVFIEILDAELGYVWVCKECFLESVKECEEERLRFQKENDKYFNALSNLKALIGRGEDIGFSKDKINKINEIIDNALTPKEEK